MPGRARVLLSVSQARRPVALESSALRSCFFRPNRVDVGVHRRERNASYLSPC
jgi:hypothetical protein